jgi:hypothetical protein
MPTTHVLESTAESVSAGTLDPARPAALTIESGDIVSYPNTWTQWGNQADCVLATIDWLHAHAQRDRRDAYVLCSMAVSFRVTQYANQTGSVYTSIPPRAIHAMIPKAVLGDSLVARIDASMRPQA